MSFIDTDGRSVRFLTRAQNWAIINESAPRSSKKCSSTGTRPTPTTPARISARTRSVPVLGAADPLLLGATGSVARTWIVVSATRTPSSGSRESVRFRSFFTVRSGRLLVSAVAPIDDRGAQRSPRARLAMDVLAPSEWGRVLGVVLGAAGGRDGGCASDCGVNRPPWAEAPLRPLSR